MSKYSVMIAEEDADIDAELPGKGEHVHVDVHEAVGYVVLLRRHVWMNIIILTPQLLRLT